MSDIFYVVGIDPGSNTGVAIAGLSAVDLSIRSLESFTLKLTDVDNVDNIMLNRVQYLQKVCKLLANRYNPNAIGVEAAFLNSRFPKAVMQLSQYTMAIEQTFYSHDSFVKIFRYPPKYVKKYIGAGGNADKDDMTRAVFNIAELSNKIDLNVLTEHEIDAMAILYITVDNIRRQPHLLITF